MEILRDCTRILSDADALRPYFTKISRKIQNAVAPYATLPYARASKAHRPTELNLQNLQNLVNKLTKPTKLNLLNLLN